MRAHLFDRTWPGNSKATGRLSAGGDATGGCADCWTCWGGAASPVDTALAGAVLSAPGWLSSPSDVALAAAPAGAGDANGTAKLCAAMEASASAAAARLAARAARAASRSRCRFATSARLVHAAMLWALAAAAAVCTSQARLSTPKAKSQFCSAVLHRTRVHGIKVSRPARHHIQAIIVQCPPITRVHVWKRCLGDVCMHAAASMVRTAGNAGAHIRACGHWVVQQTCTDMHQYAPMRRCACMCTIHMDAHLHIAR
jgi:hypothetical protein